MTKNQQRIAHTLSPEDYIKFKEFCYMMSLYNKARHLDMIDKQKEEDRIHSECLEEAYGSAGQD